MTDFPQGEIVSKTLFSTPTNSTAKVIGDTTRTKRKKTTTGRKHIGRRPIHIHKQRIALLFFRRYFVDAVDGTYREKIGFYNYF